MSQRSDKMRECIAGLAGQREWNDTRESWLNRAADRAGITYRTMRDIFYGRITDESHYAVQLLKLAYARKSALDQVALFERVAAGLERTDPAFHCDHIAALRSAADALRGVGVPRNGRE